MRGKRRAKWLFATLGRIARVDKRLFALTITYKKYVLFEPVDPKKYRATLSNVAAQFAAEMSSPRSFYLLDPNGLVISASAKADSVGQIQWVSRNAAAVLEADEKYLRSLNVTALMPAEVGRCHNELVLDYLRYSRSVFVNKVAELVAVTVRGRLINVRLVVKLFLDARGISFFSYIKRTSELMPVFLNRMGEVQSFGRHFAELTGLQYDFSKWCGNISLFFFMPQALLHFLAEFYELPDFEFLDADRVDLERTYLIVPRDATTRLLEFSKEVARGGRTPRDYARVLCEAVRRLTFADVAEVYAVRVSMDRRTVQKPKIDIRFMVMNIHEVRRVTKSFTESNFRAFYRFLDKVDFREETLISIQTYQERREKLREARQRQKEEEGSRSVLEPGGREEVPDEVVEALGITRADFEKLEAAARAPKKAPVAESQILRSVSGESKAATPLARMKMTARSRFSILHEIAKSTRRTLQDIESQFTGTAWAGARSILQKALTKYTDLDRYRTPDASVRNSWIDLVRRYETKTRVVLHSTKGSQIGRLTRDTAGRLPTGRPAGGGTRAYGATRGQRRERRAAGRADGEPGLRARQRVHAVVVRA